MGTMHTSPYSGQWYPASAAELEALLEEKYASSRGRTAPLLSGALGLVVPHAGPAYSGTVAAVAYRTLQMQRAERIVLLAFPHHGLLRGVAAPDVEGIATPLGMQPLDRPFTREFRTVPESRLCDHSLEIQLPFLQKSVPQASVIPLYVGHLSADERIEAAGVLGAAWRPGTVFVASSDFTHYGPDFGHLPFPVDGHTPERLRDLDFEYIEAAGSLDAERFLDTLARHKGNVCGAGPLALLMDVLRSLDPAGIYPSTLDYQTSGELTGDWRHSVSYAALAFHPASSLRLSDEDSADLLDSAGETLRRLRVEGDRRGVRVVSTSEALATRRGAFVSLHRGEELLGCIGNLAGRNSLAEEISQLAIAAAKDDPRFQPAMSSEGPIDIEISVMTPFRRIYGAGDLQVGRHGAWLKLDGQSGLLLPQVAEGRGWTSEDFLRALERKSGLWRDAWRHPSAKLFVFEAQLLISRPGLRGRTSGFPDCPVR